MPGGNARENPAKTRGFEVEKKKPTKGQQLRQHACSKKSPVIVSYFFVPGGSAREHPAKARGFEVEKKKPTKGT